MALQLLNSLQSANEVLPSIHVAEQSLSARVRHVGGKRLHRLPRPGDSGLSPTVAALRLSPPAAGCWQA